MAGNKKGEANHHPSIEFIKSQQATVMNDWTNIAQICCTTLEGEGEPGKYLSPLNKKEVHNEKG